MPNAGEIKLYAVRNGRQGARIYASWEEAKKNVGDAEVCTVLRAY